MQSILIIAETPFSPLLIPCSLKIISISSILITLIGTLLRTAIGTIIGSAITITSYVILHIQYIKLTYILIILYIKKSLN